MPPVKGAKATTAVLEKLKPSKETVVNVRPINLKIATFTVQGTAPLVQQKFSEKAKRKMMEQMLKTMEERAKRKVREPRDFNDDYKQAQYLSDDGWNGIPAIAFRAAMIDACRKTDLPMTRAKMAIFIIADGYTTDGSPLVKILSKKGPERHEGLVRNETGVADVRIRPMWKQWEAKIKVQFDADMISADSIVNLLNIAGHQIGVGEGRPFSRNSVGQGWGTFKVLSQ